MSPRRTRGAGGAPPGTPPGAAPLTLRLDGDTLLQIKVSADAPLQVKLVAPEPPQPQPNLRLWFFGIGFGIVGLFLIVLWSSYVFPRTRPAPIDVAPLPLAIALDQPGSVAFGDAAGLDVTVINRGATAISGTATVVFSGTVGVRPPGGETTSLSFDLPAGASMTRRVAFAMPPTPIFYSGETVQFWVLVAANNQSARTNPEQRIAVAGLPYVNSILSYLFSSTILIGAGTFLWDEIKKRVFGAGGK
jgi:hypothetical protein